MDMNAFSLEGKVALVTGAAYGIGFAIAEAFAAAGAKICFNCRGEHHMEAAMKAYAEKGIDAHGYYCDVTKEEEVKEMVAKIEEEVGVIDILVNNAGIIKRIPMIEMSAEDFRQVIDIDLNAPFIVSKAVIPGMIKKGHGKIINICSMMSELGREPATSAPSTASTTSSATASAPDTSLHRRPRLCVSASRTAAVIPLTSSSSPRLRPRAGELRKT